MHDAALPYLVCACLYAGFQVTIRGLVYPQMTLLPAPAWVAYERAHQRRVSVVVGPLFAALVLSTGRLAFGDVPLAGELAAVGLLAVLLTVTAFGASPLHTRLSAAFDPATHRRLLHWDTARVAIAVAQVVLGVVLAVA